MDVSNLQQSTLLFYFWGQYNLFEEKALVNNLSVMICNTILLNSKNVCQRKYIKNTPSDEIKGIRIQFCKTLSKTFY